MTKRRTEEEIKEIIEEFGYAFIEEYRTTSNIPRVVFLDNLGYKYDGDLRNLIKGHTPRFVGKENFYTLSNISLWLKNNDKSFILSMNNIYIGNHSKLLFKCTKESCLEEFSMTWHNVYAGQECPYCVGRRAGKLNNLEYLRPDLMKEWDYLKNKINPNEITIASNEKVWWICKNCKRSWESFIYSRTLENKGCQKCSAEKLGLNNRKAAEEFVKEVFDAVESEYSILSEYETSNKKVKVIHNLCGHTWDVNPVAFISGGTRCPKCRFTKGENNINRWLSKNNILFDAQKKFSNCKLKRILSFDFYLPDYNLCIEYDGILHFEDKFNNPEEFKLTKKRDKIKTKYCKDNNINLLRIPYWEFDNIENILEQTLSKLG